MRKTLVPVAVGLCVLLASCGSTPNGTDVSFLGQVRVDAALSTVTDAALIDLGHRVCALMTPNATLADLDALTSKSTALGLSDADSKVLDNAAMNAYCPPAKP